MKKIIIILSLILVVNTIAKAQQKDSLNKDSINKDLTFKIDSNEFEKDYIFEFSTGFNDLLYLNYYNFENVVLAERKFLTRRNEFNFNYFKGRLLYNFDEKWDFALSLSLQKIRYDDTFKGFFGRMNIGLNYYPYIYKKNKIGVAFDVGVHSAGTWPSFGFGAYWIHTLSPRFDLVINPVLDVNFWEQEKYNYTTYRYNYERSLRSNIISLNVGLRIKPVYKAEDYEYYEEIGRAHV